MTVTEEVRKKFEEWFAEEFEHLSPIGVEAASVWAIFKPAYQLGVEAMREAAAEHLEDEHECDCGAPKAMYNTECGHAMNCPHYDAAAIRNLKG